jgi:hypothetical protein
MPQELSHEKNAENVVRLADELTQALDEQEVIQEQPSGKLKSEKKANVAFSTSGHCRGPITFNDNSLPVLQAR